MRLREISPLIHKISEGQNLTAEEAQLAFDVCTQEDEEFYYWVALTMGLHAKGETSDELLGLARSTERFAPRIDLAIDPSDIIDVSGTGGDSIKTLNVSTASAFVVAASGVWVAKQGFRSVTGFTGSVDILEELGINLMDSYRTPRAVAETLSAAGIVIFFTPFLSEKFRYRSLLPRKMAEIGLRYKWPFHLAAFAYSPVPMTTRLYGVYSPKYLRVLAELFQKLGYERGIVCYGEPGLDEISNLGETQILEFSADSIEEYRVMPRDLGLRQAEATEIQTSSKDENMADFLRVLYGVETGPKRDIVAANAGAALYLMGKADDLGSGVTLAQELIAEGAAADKLRDFVGVAASEERLAQLEERWL